MGFFQRVHGVTLNDKVYVPVKFAETSMLNYFSSESRVPNYVGSAMCPDCHTKDWRGKPFWLNPRESRPEVVQGQGGVRLHLRPCLVPSSCGASRITWNCCWPWGISSPPGTVALRSSPEEKRAWKRINQYFYHCNAKMSWKFYTQSVPSGVTTPKFVGYKYLDFKRATLFDYFVWDTAFQRTKRQDML